MVPKTDKVPNCIGTHFQMRKMDAQNAQIVSIRDVFDIFADNRTKASIMVQRARQKAFNYSMHSSYRLQFAFTVLSVCDHPQTPSL